MSDQHSLTSDTSLTPKTDAAVWYAEHDSMPQIPVVDADFARAQERRIVELERALKRIETWHGEFPETGRQWDDGSPMSYGACFGSNGERDFMRQIATDALNGSEP